MVPYNKVSIIKSILVRMTSDVNPCQAVVPQLPALARHLAAIQAELKCAIWQVT